MSTSIVPKISVTADKHLQDGYEHHSTTASSESDDCNDKDTNQNFGGLTDVEDFDSCTDLERPRSRKSSKNILYIPNCLSSTQGDFTDVEDYNDSEADEVDNQSAVLPEIKISLREFLRHDFQENFSSGNGTKEIKDYKTGNFLQDQNLNLLNDCLTDCEDFNTDSETENNYEKSACVDLKEAFVEHVNITDSNAKAKDFESSECDNDDISIFSESSCAVSALSDVNGKELQAMSEDEIFEVSSNEEEVYQISCSDSDSISNSGCILEDDLLSGASMPPIDVTFIHPTKRPLLNNDLFLQNVPSKSDLSKNKLLEVERKIKEEVLTDTECFDDSKAESCDEDSFDGDEDNQQPIPQAVIMTIYNDGECSTDCEDLFCDETSEAAAFGLESALSVDVNAIPQPQREVVILLEDKFGDTTTNVMPMDKEFQFGICGKKSDERLTDTEEYSCSDDGDMLLLFANFPSRSPSPSPQNLLVEFDVTIANELIKTQQSKRSEILSNVESVTDVEEIYMAGTSARKKKLKSRTITKSKSKFLETPKPYMKEDSGTDTEDMDFSDSGLLTPLKCVKKITANHQPNQFCSEKATDIEENTADDVSSVSEAEMPHIDTNMTNLKEYEASSKNIVFTFETCEPMQNIKNNNCKIEKDLDYIGENSLIKNQNLQQQQTDVEDIQLPSDTEESINIGVPTIYCVCQELTDMLSESCTTVHEQCVNSFNIDYEKLHIKGMQRETHTDIEYVESDESAATSGK